MASSDAASSLKIQSSKKDFVNYHTLQWLRWEFFVLIRLYENTFENASDRILRTQLYVYVIVMQKKNYRKFSVAVLKDSMEALT